MQGFTFALILGVVATSVIVGGAQTLTAPANLLRNSHFWWASNGEVPDWWGTGVPERIRQWHGCLSLEEGAPLPGVRALRLFNPQEGTPFQLQSYAYALPIGKPYTFSVYLRAERENFPVTLRIGYDQSTRVLVSTKWQRFVFTATPKRGHWAPGRLIVAVSFSQTGPLWVAAPPFE